MRKMLLAIMLLPWSINVTLATKIRVIEVELKKMVVVSETQVKLSDLVTLHGADRQLRRSLEKVIIERAPRVGYQTLVSQHKVIAALSEMDSAANTWIVVSKNKSVIVKTVGRSYALYDVISLAKKRLNKELIGLYSTFTVRSVIRQTNILLPHGKIDLYVKPVNVVNVVNVKKRMRVWVDIYVDNVHYQTIPVWFAITVRNFALVARHKIRSGQVLYDNLFYRKEIDLTEISGNAVSAETTLVDKRLRFQLPKDGVLTQDALQTLPEVVAGEEVRVSVHKGNIKLLTKAMALQDGRVGDVVMVSNVKSKQKYRVTVVGRHQVRIAKEQNHEN